VSSVADITKADVDTARSLAGVHPALSSRDCLHVALMRRLDCVRVWTFDAAYDAVPSLQRIS